MKTKHLTVRVMQGNNVVKMRFSAMDAHEVADLMMLVSDHCDGAILTVYGTEEAEDAD